MMLLAPLAAVTAQAQIRYITKQALHTPVPPMPLLTVTQPSTVPPTGTAVPAAAKPTPPVPAAALAGSDFDKTEVEKRVISFQKQRAQEGSASAAYELGLRYLKGDGVEKDTERARQWLALAAKSGSSQAQQKLAELGPAAKADNRP